MKRALRFAARHRWSLPLSALSGACFAELADELRDGELNAFDSAVSRAVTRARGSLDAPMYWLTRLGDGVTLTVVVVIVTAVLLACKRIREASFVVLVGTGTLTWIYLLKHLFQRARPEAGELYFLSTPKSFSFPSGHAFGATGVLLGMLLVARALGIRGKRLGALAALTSVVILGVAMSRVYFGVHFPSDVLGGMLGGAAWVAAVTGFFYPAALPGEHSK